MNLRRDHRYRPGTWFQVFVDHPAIQMVEVIYGPKYVQGIIDIICHRYDNKGLTKEDAKLLIEYAVLEFKIGLYLYQHPEAFEHEQGPALKTSQGFKVYPKTILDLEKIAEAVKIPIDKMEKLILFWNHYPEESPGKRIHELIDIFKKKGFPSPDPIPSKENR